MAFLRIKEINGNEYYYLQENRWTSEGPRVKKQKYIGPVSSTSLQEIKEEYGDDLTIGEGLEEKGGEVSVYDSSHPLHDYAGRRTLDIGELEVLLEVIKQFYRGFKGGGESKIIKTPDGEKWKVTKQQAKYLEDLFGKIVGRAKKSMEMQKRSGTLGDPLDAEVKIKLDAVDIREISDMFCYFEARQRVDLFAVAQREELSKEDYEEEWGWLPRDEAEKLQRKIGRTLKDSIGGLIGYARSGGANDEVISKLRGIHKNAGDLSQERFHVGGGEGKIEWAPVDELLKRYREAVKESDAE